MNYSKYQKVVLTRDVLEENLCAGDLVTIVEFLPATPQSGNESGVALEAFNALGQTTAVIFTPVSAIRPLAEDEVLHIRKTPVAV